MSAPPAAVPRPTTNLALAFQEVFTLILRTRYKAQPVESADRFRSAASRLITESSHRVRDLGYSKDITTMAIYATVGFLDESILNSRDPAFADWARCPLGQQIFGDLLAGEGFFRDVVDLLQRPESPEVADILEIHCLCLLLGFRGKYAYENQAELHVILQRIRARIDRIRGPLTLSPPSPRPAPPSIPATDPWARRLSVLALSLAVLCLVAFLAYLLILRQGAPTVLQGVSLSRPSILGLTRDWKPFA